MSAFSPGPWRFVPAASATDSVGMFLDADGRIVCHFGEAAQYYPSEGCPPDSDNARLMEAAPQMHALLMEWTEGHERKPGCAWPPGSEGPCTRCRTLDLLARIDGVVQDAAEASAPPEEP